MSIVLPRLQLLVDLDRDGSYETDFSDYLEEAQWGLKRENALQNFNPRTVKLTLDNADKRFSPPNRSSPYYPDIRRGLPVQLKVYLDGLPALVNYDENPSYEITGDGAYAEGATTLTVRPCQFWDGFEEDTSNDYTTTGTWTWNTTSSRVEGTTAGFCERDVFKAADCFVGAVLTRADAGGMIMRKTSANDYYSIFIADDDAAFSPGSLRIFSFKSGESSRPLGSTISIDFERGTPHILGVEITGTDPVQFRIFWDRVKVATVTDSDPLRHQLAGAVALQCIAESIYAGSFQAIDYDAKAYKGKSALAVDVPNTDAVGHCKRLTSGGRYTVTAGIKYVYSPCLVVDGSTTKNFRLKIEWYNSTPALISTTTRDVTGGLEWERHFVIGEAPTGAVTAQCFTVTQGAQGTFTYWADGEMFYPTAKAVAGFGADDVEPYCDGDQPFCSWFGSEEHVAISSRPASPSRTVYTGKIRGIVPKRAKREGQVVLESGGWIESLTRTQFQAGPFSRKSAKLIVQRLVDLLETPELITDGSSHFVGPGWIPMPGGEVVGMGADNLQDSGKGGGVDPSEYAALEGDRVQYFEMLGDQTDRYYYIDLTDVTDAGEGYITSGVLSTDDEDVDGRTVIVQLWDNVDGVVGYGNIVLSNTILQRWRFTGTFHASSTTREIRLLQSGSWVGPVSTFFADTPHLAPAISEIDRTFLGDSWDEDLEYLDAFDRSASATFDEAVRSAGGWLYEDGDEGLIFEDWTYRLTNAIPHVRISDSLDGFAPDDDLRRGSAALTEYGLIRVGSLGDLSLITGAVRNVYAHEPVPFTLSANLLQVFHVMYATEETIGLIARRAAVRYYVSAGSLVSDDYKATPYIASYGTSGRIVLKAGGSGVTIDYLAIEARAQSRASDRTFYEEIAPGAETEEPLELDMSAQGTRTDLMKMVAKWAAERYGRAPATYDLTLTPTTTEEMLEAIGRDVGLPVWFRHQLGVGAWGEDILTYLEGITVTYNAKLGTLEATLVLEEA